MTAAHHHDTGPTQHRGGHPVIKGFLILVEGRQPYCMQSLCLRSER